MTRFFLFLFLSVCKMAVGQTLPKHVTHLQVQRLNDSVMDVYLYKTPQQQKRPLLLFCQGSGYDSNTEGFLGLASLYADKAVGMVIEKQGIRYSDRGDTLRTEYVEHNTVYNRLYDYLRALQYLRSNAHWWNGDVYVIGGSEGGLLAGMLACYYPNVKGLAILCYGGGLKFGEAWPIASGLQKKAEGGDSTAVFAAQKEAADSLQLIRTQANFKQWYSGADNSFAWWASVVDLRLSNALIDTSIPIFVGQGSEDLMAPPVSAQKLKAAFDARGKKNLQLRMYDGLDHSFADKKGASHLVEVFRQAVDWLLKRNEQPFSRMD